MPLGAHAAAIRGASGRTAGGANYFVGSFALRSGTGSQAVTGVGFTPKALLMFATTEAASGTWQGGIYTVLGMTSGAAESYSVSGSAQDNVATSNTGRRIAANALTAVSWDGATTWLTADLTSFDADGFTLNVTANSLAGLNISFLAIGGSGVSAKAVNWTSPTTATTKAVTGVGFTPDLVLHATTNALQTALGSNTTMTLGFGAMDSAGGQWCNAVGSQDNQAAANTNRYQRTDRCLAIIQAGPLTVDAEATFSSMDADGFTTNWTTASGFATQNISLCLDGVSAKVGSFNKTTSAAPVSQAVTGVGFGPSAALFTSVGVPAIATVEAGLIWNTSAADGTNERAVSMVDQDGVSPTQADSVWRNDKAIALSNGFLNHNSGEADLTSFDADGFTVNWTTNDAFARQVLYLALG